MRQLNKTQNAIFLIGALLMVVGAGASVLAWKPAPYVFALGALAFTSMQFLQRYEGTNFVIRRLRRMMLLSDFLPALRPVDVREHGKRVRTKSYRLYYLYI